MRYLAPLVILLLLGAATAPGPAMAQPYPGGARERVQSGQVRPLGDILNDVRRQRPGSLADVQGPTVGPGGEPRYRLKWVSPNGRVEWLDTDARTGRVLGVPGPDRGPRVLPNAPIPNGPGPRAIGPRRQNFAPPIGPPVLGPVGLRPGFGRGPGGFSRFGGRPGAEPGFGRFGGPAGPGRPGGPGPRFRQGR